MLAAFVGCQSSGNQSSSPESAQQGAATGPASQSTNMNGRRSARRAAESSPSGQPAQAAQPRTITRTFTLAAGTPIPIRLSTELNTGTTAQGTVFDGTLETPLIVDGVTVASRGSLVHGRVTNVVSSGRLKQPAELSLMLTSITPTGGQQTPISTQAWTVSGKSHKRRDIEMMGGGAAVGAVIGAIAGGGKGAAIGTLVGGAGGTGAAYATGKKEIDIPTETQITFRLSAPASFTMQQTQ